MCEIENAVDCSIDPSPNDQVHVASSTLELTLKTTASPAVALPLTFRKATGSVGVVGGVFPPEATTSVCALSVPTDAVTSAVSLDVSVAVATPFEPVDACAGAIVPRVVVNVTTTFGNPAPFTFCTVADTAAEPDCAPVPGAAPTVT
jgi:hypothetical protein